MSDSNINSISLNNSERHSNCNIKSCILYVEKTLYFISICCVILNIIYSIIALINSSIEETHDKCPSSNLWIYLVVIVIGGIVNNILTVKLYFNSNNKCLIIFGLITHAILICWGIYELLFVICINELKSNMLYPIVVINVIAQVVLFCIIIYNL